MARLNVATKIPVQHTAEGAIASRITPVQQLRRLVMTCMLWEDNFYMDGKSVADLIASTIPLVKPHQVAGIAIEARETSKLRHVPLLLARELARGSAEARLEVGDLLARIIQRPDELTEFLAIYWKDGRQPLSGQVKKGLARAFAKFDEYSLSKYNRDGAIKLRDVLFLTHSKPAGKVQEKLYKKLVDGQMASADTWEMNLSAGSDKKTTWERLINEDQLGGLAMLRNLRNMQEVGVSDALIRKGLNNMKVERVLPFRFIAASKYAPRFEPELETAMFKSIANHEKLPGKTVLLVDNSGSMHPVHFGSAAMISAKSELSRIDAACALAMLVREVCEDCQIIVFSDQAKVIRPRRGFALRDEILKETVGGTHIGRAVEVAANEGYDRIIVLTDEQTAVRGNYQKSAVPAPLPGTKGYFINVACEKNGVGYGTWNHIDGWSEACIDFILMTEGLSKSGDDLDVKPAEAKTGSRIVSKTTKSAAIKKAMAKASTKARTASYVKPKKTAVKTAQRSLVS